MINAMLEGVARLMRVGDRTVGVEQRDWALEVKVEAASGSTETRLLELRIFDFAGQAEYLFTHHMFLGANGLCIVAFDLHKYRAHHLRRMLLQFVGMLQSRVPVLASLAVPLAQRWLVSTSASILVLHPIYFVLLEPVDISGNYAADQSV